jgi:uncharacterized protein YceK
MEKRYILVSLIPILCFSLTGCASIGARCELYGSPPNDQLYPGTRFDWKQVSDSLGGEHFAMFWFIDLPFSFILDTIMLPFDAFAYFKEGRPSHKPVKKTTTEAIEESMRTRVTPSGNATIQSGQ